MNDYKIGIMGGGRIAKILLGGWKQAGRLSYSIVVSDVDQGVLERLQADFPKIEIAHQQNEKAATQDIVILALHPPAIAPCLAEIQNSLRPESILVSLAPKWPLNKISQALGGFGRVVRMIPNAPSLVGQGFNPISYGSALSIPERNEIASLFRPLGACPEVVEDTLEAYAIVAAMGPTYFWYQLYQLIDLSRSFGLTQEAAITAVINMVQGTIKTMTDSGLSKEAVMDLIPVKPLANIESLVKESYRDTLSDLFRKLKT